MAIPEEVSRAGTDAETTYLRSLEAGGTVAFATMCALQCPPGTKGTDRAFMQGRLNNQQLDEMPVRSAQWMLKETKEAGINITGKHYVGGIADKRGWCDPRAWVSGNDDILTVARERRLTVSGSVSHDGGIDPPKRVKINEKIVKDQMRVARKANPGMREGDLRETVIKRHTYQAKGR
jgi:hypothetical protein